MDKENKILYPILKFLVGAMSGAFVLACFALAEIIPVSWLKITAILVPLISGSLTVWKGQRFLELLLSIGPQ
jgi:uncharacterized membrane protein YoaK (UPF0700 family)